jgi:hypothetical protein
MMCQSKRGMAGRWNVSHHRRGDVDHDEEDEENPEGGSTKRIAPRARPLCYCVDKRILSWSNNDPSLSRISWSSTTMSHIMGTGLSALVHLVVTIILSIKETSHKSPRSHYLRTTHETNVLPLSALV